MKKVFIFCTTVLSAILLMNCTTAQSYKSTIDLPTALSYVSETKDLLMGTLMKKIKENGTENALEFCNLNAIPLTQTVGEKYHINIKRVSDKNRNPNNAANAKELAIISQYKAQLFAGKEPQPLVEKNQLYVPIVTNSQCLKCHGTVGSTIEHKTAEKIKSLYPKDLAIGYKENELRGLFVVQMK